LILVQHELLEAFCGKQTTTYFSFLGQIRF